MKRLLIIILVFSVTAAVFAQRATEVGAPNAGSLGIDAAQQYLKEVSVDKFEREGFWRSSMSSDDGFTSSRLFNGSPAGKVVIPEEEGLNIQDKYVLGTRVDFIVLPFIPSGPFPLRELPKPFQCG